MGMIPWRLLLSESLKTNKSRAMIKKNLGLITATGRSLKEASACFLEAVSANPLFLLPV